MIDKAAIWFSKNEEYWMPTLRSWLENLPNQAIKEIENPHFTKILHFGIPFKDNYKLTDILNKYLVKMLMVAKSIFL